MRRRSFLSGTAAAVLGASMKKVKAFPPSSAGLHGSTGGSPTPPPGSMITVPLAAEIMTDVNDANSAYYASAGAHYNGFVAALGATPAILGNWVTVNTSNDPSTWPTFVAEQCNSAFPAMGISKPAAISTAWLWQNSSGTTIYSDMATTTNTLYGGQLIAYWVQQALATYKLYGFTNVYIRPSWEWNIGLTGNAITSGQAAVFVQAMQKFYTTCHTYATANGMTVHICWDPSVNNEPSSPANGLTLAQQFPNQNPGDNFVDIVCADFYAEGDSLASDAAGGSTYWAVTALVALAAEWNLPIGFCELGGLHYPNDGSTNAANVWIPNFVNYINSLNGVPAVAFAQLYDINQPLGSTGNVEFTAPGAGQTAIVAAWKAALGPGGNMLTLPTSR